MTILTSCGGQRALTRFIGLAIAACAMTSIMTGGTITLVIPASQQGQGEIGITSSVAYPGECYSGFGSPEIGPTCTLIESSPAGQADGGTVYGTGTAFMDAAGLHASVNLGASGNDEYSTDEAEAFYSETLTNTGFFPESFQLGFHVDAILTANDGAYSRLNIEFQNRWVPTQEQTWSYGGNGPLNEGVDSDYLTNWFTVAPGAAFSFILDIDAYTYTYSPLGTILPDAPQGIVDALNTLTITSFGAEDSFGNPLPASDFSSSDGANYSSIDTSSAPEPGTFVLCGGFMILLGVSRRRRPPSRPSHAAFPKS